MERFKRFCEVRQDHKTLTESFCSCIMKVTIQNTVMEVSLVPHLLCVTVDLKSYLQRRMYGFLLQRGKQLLCIYICLTGFYKCLYKHFYICLEKSYQLPSCCSDTHCNHQHVAQIYNRSRIQLFIFSLLKCDPNSSDGSQMGLCVNHSEGTGRQVSPFCLDKSIYRLYAFLWSDPANAHRLGVVSICRHLHVS